MQMSSSIKRPAVVARRLLCVGLITLLTALLMAPAAGATEFSGGWNKRTGIYEMIFPLDGDNRYEDNFGACRGRGCSRRHEGIDIMAKKMTRIVAVASGTIGWILDERGGECCAVAVDHDDGWRSLYIHLNNDTPRTDDGIGWGFARGISPGVHVEAGQLIGYVGDSGNAETTPAHLHFELQQPNGSEVNPFDHLRQAHVPTSERCKCFKADDAARAFAEVSLFSAVAAGVRVATLLNHFSADGVRRPDWRSQLYPLETSAR